MEYLFYGLCAILIAAFANKLSIYVCDIEQKSKLSAAFAGGIMLSAVTSLPELFTSLSSSVMLEKPGLSMGNILGSNLFNLTVLAILILICFRSFMSKTMSQGHKGVTVCVMGVYLLLFLVYINVLHFSLAIWHIASILIVIVYFIGVRFLTSDNDDSKAIVGKGYNLKQLYIRFIIVSIGIIVTSIAITYITDIIARKLNLGTGIAGAIFLGIATSLPEVFSSIVLFRMKEYDIAVGNIIGSNIFNFVIFAVVDTVSTGVYSFSDPKNLALLLFGFLATAIFAIVLATKKKSIAAVSLVGIILCYLGFLML